MVCLDTIFTSPFAASLTTGIIIVIYVILLGYSPYLPPAVFLSATAAILVYLLKGGEFMCLKLYKTSQN
jgi:hypothetical protein